MDNDTTAAHVARLDELRDKWSRHYDDHSPTVAALDFALASIAASAELQADNERLRPLIALHNGAGAAWADRAKAAEARVAALEKALRGMAARWERRIQQHREAGGARTYVSDCIDDVVTLLEQTP